MRGLVRTYNSSFFKKIKLFASILIKLCSCKPKKSFAMLGTVLGRREMGVIKAGTRKTLAAQMLKELFGYIYPNSMLMLCVKVME
ncbi:MAG: hypothetical protein R2865_08545 [Deinococcales bacterium]